MKNSLALFLLSVIVFACGNTGDETSYFITKLGHDTLAIERFTIEENQMRADVLLRSPRTTLRSYDLNWDSELKLTSMTVKDVTENRNFDGDGRIVQSIINRSDSLEVIYTTQNGDRSLKVESINGLIPFVDMVHWPYELAFNRAANISNDSIDQFMVTDRRNSNFIIHREADTNYTLRHPSRGVMMVTTSKDGELMSLDAAATTRKLKVERAFDLEFDNLAAAIAIKDQSGSPFGSLSPAIVNNYEFSDTEFQVTYGSPAKRGRDIFGGIVPYGQRWRTGANRATHFKTSNDLIIEGQTLPAGEYTLFTIPEADGGTLIINKQTGQNGQSYDESRDLMRVQLTKSDYNAMIESFTITVEEAEQGGSLNLKWDRTIYSLAFEVKE